MWRMLCAHILVLCISYSDCGLSLFSLCHQPSTSSILGAPPTAKFPGFGPSAGGSILGSAPQIPTTLYGTTRMISPPTIFNNQPLQQQTTQSSILGQPPTPPLNPQMFGPPGQQNFPGISTRQSQIIYAQPLEGSLPPSAGIIQPPPPPPFGISLIPFPSPTPNLNGQPSQNFGKDSFPGSLEPQLIPVPSSQAGMMSGHSTSTTGEISNFGVPFLYGTTSEQPNTGSNPEVSLGAPGPMLMAMSGTTPFDMPRSQIGGNNVLSQFGISLGQLGPIHDHRSAGESTTKESPPGLPKFPPGDFSKPPVMEGFPVAMPYLRTTEMAPALATSGGSILTQSANYMIVTPGILTSESQYSPSSSSEATPLAPHATDNLLPIGTERAHKSTSSLPGGSAFPVITPGETHAHLPFP